VGSGLKRTPGLAGWQYAAVQHSGYCRIAAVVSPNPSSPAGQKVVVVMTPVGLPRDFICPILLYHITLSKHLTYLIDRQTLQHHHILLFQIYTSQVPTCVHLCILLGALEGC